MRTRLTVRRCALAACGALALVLSGGIASAVDPFLDPTCRADLNGDGTVDGGDLGILLGNWGPCTLNPVPCPGDIIEDGEVDGKDLALLLGSWGIPCCIVSIVETPADDLLYLGEAYTFSAIANPEGGTYAWSVEQDDGEVTPASGAGNTFTVTAQNVSAGGGVVIVTVTYTAPGAPINQCVSKAVAQLRVRPRLTEMTFADNHVITRDSGLGAYGTPHWNDANGDADASDNGDSRFPVGYTRDTAAKIASVKFAVGGGTTATAVSVKGTGPAGEVYMKAATLAGGVVTATDITASTNLPNTVKFYNTYDIDWEVTFDGTTLPAGKSDNRVYVVRSDPILGGNNYESVFDIACRNADGQAAEADVVNGVWMDMADLNTPRKAIDGFNDADGVRMGYWRPDEGVCQSLALMLASPTGNGACGAWATLFRFCLGAHGIGTTTFVEIQADVAVNAGADGFLVKNWGFGRNIHTGANGVCNTTAAATDVQAIPVGQGMPNRTCIKPGGDGTIESVPGGDDIKIGNVEINTGPNGVRETVMAATDANAAPAIAMGAGQADQACVLAGGDGTLETAPPGGDDMMNANAGGIPNYPFVLDDTAVNRPGVAGQDNEEPPRAFFNHFVVRYMAMIYDPSYGVGPATEVNHENAAIDGIRNTPNAKMDDNTVVELDYDP